MKYLIALFILASNLQAESKPWSTVLLDRNSMSPVDELVINQFPKDDKIYKVSHPDVSLVKIYLGTVNSKVIYAVWKWKPMPSGWDIMDASGWNSETKIAKGIPLEFLDHLHLQDRPSYDYKGKYKRALPKIRKFKQQTVTSNAKGCVEFKHDGYTGRPSVEAITRFYIDHRVTAAFPVVTGDSARTDVVLCYDDGTAPVQQNIAYEIENE